MTNNKKSKIIESKTIKNKNKNINTKKLSHKIYAESSQVKILSWNIQSQNTITGNKFNDPLFIKNFDLHSILCLQETRQAPKLAGFRTLSNIRPNGKSGGVCTLYRNELLGGIEPVTKFKLADVLICKMNKTFFKLQKDIYIVNVYIRPNNSPNRHTYDGRETLNQLENVINDLHKDGDVILCGDFNARIGHSSGYIDNENDSLDKFIPLPDDYLPDSDMVHKRQTMDKICNAYKNDFLSIITHNQLTILNGRTLGDFTGNYTCIHHNGSSVIDYFATSRNIILTKLVQHMSIKPFTPFSDHKPVSLTLSLYNIPNHKLTDINSTFSTAPVRFLFHENSRQALIDHQNSPEVISLRNNIENRHSVPNISASTSDFNSDFTNYLYNISSYCLKETKPNKPNKNKFEKHNPWFNHQCRLAKRELNKATRSVSNFPSSDFLRKNYYKVKKSYKKLLKNSKQKYFKKLNSDIENGCILNWQKFKRLKSKHQDELQFDGYDMLNFENFYKNLYSDSHSTISDDQKKKLQTEADKLNTDTFNHSDILNSHITKEEVQTVISSLKPGKASSFDQIANEILKSLTHENIDLLTKLFNHCFDSGIYPWNKSVITTLHKKGSKSNPDNYRAIAVSSNIGKLFSTILLNRLIDYRNLSCPDPINQLGFTKKAQTYDHILTLNTIINKYKKKKSNKLYALFVDFRKAFDSVCRQALLLKLAKNGITGKFYTLLKHMYTNSRACIKLSGYLSNEFDIKKGTEQGHPLSPDLFKLFLKDLSPLLDFKHCPELSGTLVSHLLWADDLIIFALDDSTLHKQLNNLSKFCSDWGLEINVDKTKVMLLNHNDVNNIKPDFYINGLKVEYTDSYCYLGIIIDKSGHFKLAKQNLKCKAMRALFSLKRSIIKTELTFRSLTTLFDALIKPIVLYGAPIWTPTSPIIKALYEDFRNNNSHRNLLKKLSATYTEKVHLHFLKWALGIHKKSSNVGAWGESGRYPLVYECIKLTLNYFERVDTLNDDSLVSAALREQKSLNLNWYKNIENLLKIDRNYNLDHVAASNYHANSDSQNRNTNKNSSSATSNITAKPSEFLIHNGFIKAPNPSLVKILSTSKIAKPIPSRQYSPRIIHSLVKKKFVDHWEYAKSTSPKLQFYNSLKGSFSKESYLDTLTIAHDRYYLTRLKISAHDLKIERGRYNNIERNKRFCTWCQISMDVDNIEDECHLLDTCDLYAKYRSKLFTDIITLTNKVHTSIISGTTPNMHLNTSQQSTHYNISYYLNIMSEPSTRSETSLPNNTKSQLFIKVAHFIHKCFKARESLSKAPVIKSHSHLKSKSDQEISVTSALLDRLTDSNSSVAIPFAIPVIARTRKF